MKPRSLRSLGPVKSSTFFLSNQRSKGRLMDGGREMMEERGRVRDVSPVETACKHATGAEASGISRNQTN